MQNRPRSLPNAIFFCIFFRIAFGHLRGPILIGSGVRKWSKNRSQIDVRSDLAENVKSLKKKPYVFIGFLRIRRVGNPVKIVFEPSFANDAQPPSKNVLQNGQHGAQNDPSNGPSRLLEQDRGPIFSSSRKDRKRY